MMTDEFSVADDASPGDWIASRLRGEFGAVTLEVPSGYEAYVRICHPARDRNGKLVKWLDVAKTTGRDAHPLMQWQSLSGSLDSEGLVGSRWEGQPPDRGNLPPHLLNELCQRLEHHTTAAEHCFFGLWIGWGWVGDGGILTKMERRGSGSSVGSVTEAVPPAFTTDEINRACLRLPDRDYVLLTGPLSAASKICDPSAPSRSASQSPNLFWPADHAWFVASEIDFDSTLVGGSAELIQAIVATPVLDAWRVGPNDSLAVDADKINRCR